MQVTERYHRTSALLASTKCRAALCRKERGDECRRSMIEQSERVITSADRQHAEEKGEESKREFAIADKRIQNSRGSSKAAAEYRGSASVMVARSKCASNAERFVVPETLDIERKTQTECDEDDSEQWTNLLMRCRDKLNTVVAS